MATERNYGNNSNFQNRLRIGIGNISTTSEPDSETHRAVIPDCISCTKNRTGIPKSIRCRIICGKLIDNELKSKRHRTPDAIVIPSKKIIIGNADKITKEDAIMIARMTKLIDETK